MTTTTMSQTGLRLESKDFPGLHQLATEKLQRIYAQREEILEAFIAKYGEPPDAYEQVIKQNGSETIWYVRLRSKTST